MILEIVQTATDSLKNASENGGGSGWIMHHVLDSHKLDFSPFTVIQLPHIEVFGIDISITKHIVFMWFAVLILLAIFFYVAKEHKKSRIPSGLSNLMEILVVFVRDDIAKSTIGKGYEKFLSYLLTIFFFILFCNLIGLIPYGSTPTSNIAVTATLATLSFLVIQGGGIIKYGAFGYFKGLMPHGIPIWLLPIMFVVEILGLFTKPFALAVRLFANMTAGHVVIFALIGLIFILKTYFVAPVSVAFALFIFLLEILVALIQAYIFTVLSGIFIGMAVHQEH